MGRYTQEYPGCMADTLGTEKTKFEKICDKQKMEGLKLHAPFADEEEWELVKWLMKNVGQTKVDDFLKFPIVSNIVYSFQTKRWLTVTSQTKNRLNLSVHNNRLLLQKVDSLTTGPEWTCEIVMAHENEVGQDGTMMTEDLELWKHNPVECVKKLIGNLSFQNLVSYSDSKR